MCAAKQNPHAVVVPYPAQGHINPMMHLARKLASDGFLISFVNTEFNHARILEARKKMKSGVPSEARLDAAIRLMSIPDGLPPDDPRTNFAKLSDSMAKCTATFLRELIHTINQSEDHKVTCLIVDANMACWTLDVARDFHMPSAAFWPALIAAYGILYNIRTLLSSGVLPSSGVPKENSVVGCFASVPAFNAQDLPWLVGSEDERALHFGFKVRNVERVKEMEWVLFNSFYELDAPVIDGLFPKEASIRCIGPLIPRRILQGSLDGKGENCAGFWAEEAECLDWLAKQAPRTVIYVSFGSIAMLNALQFEELAMALEATGRPFLWVVRSDLMNGSEEAFPRGFKERVRDRGCLVSWAPQLSVLFHPSVACFLTHCGWNSTLESIAAGVPMLCWPYFADQFVNRTFVVDAWKIGLGLNANKDGIIEKGEIEEALQRVLGKEEGVEIRKRAMKLKESAREAVKEGGSSSANYDLFVNAMGRNLTEGICISHGQRGTTKGLALQNTNICRSQLATHDRRE